MRVNDFSTLTVYAVICIGPATDEKCGLCSKQKVNVVYYPCSHAKCCITCSTTSILLRNTKIINMHCDTCRQPIDEVIAIRKIGTGCACVYMLIFLTKYIVQ